MGMGEMAFKFRFSKLFDGKGMAIFSLALSPASRELPQRGSLWKTVDGKGFLLKNGTKGSPSGGAPAAGG